MRKYYGNLKHFLGLSPKPHQGSALDPPGGLTVLPPNPQLIIVIAVQSFSQNNKKNDQLIFSYFDHWLIKCYKTSFFLWNTNNTDRNGVYK